MTAVVKRKVGYRLGELVRQPGGRTVAAIEAEVDARLETLKDACLAEAQAQVRRLERLAEALPHPPAAEDLPPFYGPCNEILSLAGVSDLAHAGHAALSLCRLLDGWIHGEPWWSAPFRVHLDALALLCRPDCDRDPAARDRILEGLERVVERQRLRGAALPAPSRRLA